MRRISYVLFGVCVGAFVGSHIGAVIDAITSVFAYELITLFVCMLLGGYLWYRIPRD